MARQKTTLPALSKKVAAGIPLTMITCYDYPTAHLVEQAEVDIVLVGDSLGMTVLGYESTLPVTMADMIRHAQAVRRGSPSSWLIGDMPYMSYQPSVESAIRNAGRFLAEAGCDAVKLEGGVEMADRVAGIVACGVPVMGHLGLTPQSASALGGFRPQGKDAAGARRIADAAVALEQAGAFAILLELVPVSLCELITRRARIPIISLGSGPRAHGQLLIFHDMFGLYPRFKPRMARVYADAGALILDGLRRYVADVAERRFPQPENCFDMDEQQLSALKDLLRDAPNAAASAEPPRGGAP